MAAIGYQKTPARWRGVWFGASIWLAEDHFLSVRNMRFTEEYARYYYRDIQALLLRRCPRWWMPSWMAGVLFALAVVALVFLRFKPQFVTLPCVLLFAALVGWALYRSLAQSCRCHVVTAVGTEELPGIQYLPAARKVIAEVNQRVVAAQGALPDNWEEAWQRRLSEKPIKRLVSMAVSNTASSVSPWRLRWGVAAAVLALASTLLDGLITFGVLRLGALPGWVGITNVLIGIVAAVLAVIELAPVPRLHWLRNIAAASALFVGLVTYVSHTLGAIIGAMPRKNAAALITINNGIGHLNVWGDFLLVAIAVALWIRWRWSSPGAEPLAVMGEP